MTTYLPISNYTDILSSHTGTEGGQSSTGSIVAWAKRLFSVPGSDITYQSLDKEAAAVPIGSNGLLAIETFQVRLFGLFWVSSGLFGSLWVNAWPACRLFCPINPFFSWVLWVIMDLTFLSSCRANEPQRQTLLPVGRCWV
jgi:hypothetical protein